MQIGLVLMKVGRHADSADVADYNRTRIETMKRISRIIMQRTECWGGKLLLATALTEAFRAYTSPSFQRTLLLKSSHSPWHMHWPAFSENALGDRCRWMVLPALVKT